MIFLLAFVISSETEEIYILERYKQEAMTRALLKQISNKFINLIKVFWKRKRLLNKVCKD